MYESNEALDSAFFDDDCAHFRSDEVKQALVNFERMDRPSLLPRPLVYASGLAADAIEPFLVFQPIHEESVARETVPIESGAESVEQYGDRIFNRKVGQEIREEDPEPDWDFWFKVPDDMEPQAKKAKTAGMIEVAGGAGGSFFVQADPDAAGGSFFVQADPDAAGAGAGSAGLEAGSAGPQAGAGAGAASSLEAGAGAGPARTSLPSVGVIKTERDYEFKIEKMQVILDLFSYSQYIRINLNISSRRASTLAVSSSTKITGSTGTSRRPATTAAGAISSG